MQCGERQKRPSLFVDVLHTYFKTANLLLSGLRIEASQNVDTFKPPRTGSQDTSSHNTVVRVPFP